MIRTYHKLFEPEYNEVAPEVIIEPAEIMDMDDPQVSRTQLKMQAVALFTSEWRRRTCWQDMMNIRTRSVPYEREGYEIPCTIYDPREDPAGTLLYFHGGAWSMNDHEVYDQVLRGIALFGKVRVIAPDYRLAPEYKFPTGLEDCYAALAHIEREKLAEGKLFIGGDSSGGNFAAAAALMARDRGRKDIAGQVLIYPAVIMNPELPLKSEQRYGSGYFLEYRSGQKFTSYYFDDYEEQSDHPYASPLCAGSLKNLPPALMIMAECDPLLDQELMYAARLIDEGTDVAYKYYEGMIHAFIHRPLKETIDTYKAIGDFIQSHA
ncbi:alpha/beta hydrolase [[Clostridium] hylemonae]|uniref:Hydrolase, alpha/beta domain protein n=1 Tax=[Clostridium] hylemonae DSM 15053 TaxID=553973 RepID=C0C5Y9_9FIRM|nr:alpha/beta hydrolase [[Clostridium] hylemonae]EEG72523.1 hydrolase, alpha/beta domain protein [[Clostridium] hylemonae DSM 15053]QEK16692.1 Carboxylesterase NlhH [[Clostridium] hylemonae DSM 15053]